MKKLVFAISAMLAITANAAEVGRIRNNAGGQIVLTSEKCPNHPGFYAYGFGVQTSQIIEGCHFGTDDGIMIRWTFNNSLSRYSYDSIDWSEEFKREVRKNRQSY